jgi:membrane associated rhomboid family serine protease
MFEDLDKVEQASRTCLRRAAARPALVEASLVLSAVEIPHYVEFDGHAWCLLVPHEHAEAALQELEAYQQENRRAVPSPARHVPVDSGWCGVLGYLLVIWALPWLEYTGALDWRWRELGAMAAGLVRDGQWWRTVTALTLHGDLGHIVANSMFGALFGVLAGRIYGSGFAWLLIVLGGMCGNALNAQVQPDAFRSIGASTATFAALALVGASAWRRGWFRGGDWRRSFAPVFGGIAMLVYTGLGGEDTNTDVVAHLTGFASGFVLGLLAAPLPVVGRGSGLQWLTGAMALGLVIGAWWLAGAGGAAALAR